MSLRPDLLRNKIWAEELGKLVDAVGSFSDMAAMEIMRKELVDLLPQIRLAEFPTKASISKKKKQRLSRLEKKIFNER